MSNAPGATKTKPNILLIIADDVGRFDVGAYALYVGQKLWTVVPAAYILQQHLQTFKQFPPRQAPPNFNVAGLFEDVIKTAAYGV